VRKGRFCRLAKDKIKKKRINKKRLIVVEIILLIMFILLAGRLSYLMTVTAKAYRAKAVDQWTSEITIEGKRGEILDRNGQVLALSADVYRVDLDLITLRQTLKDKKLSGNDAA